MILYRYSNPILIIVPLGQKELELPGMAGKGDGGRLSGDLRHCRFGSGGDLKDNFSEEKPIDKKWGKSMEIDCYQW